jgi:hypothetical protein
MKPYPIFRERAIEAYNHLQEEEAIPHFLAPYTLALMYLLLFLLLGLGSLLWWKSGLVSIL